MDHHSPKRNTVVSLFLIVTLLATSASAVTFFGTEEDLAAATGATGPIDPPFTASTSGPIIAGDLTFTPGLRAGEIAVANVTGNPLYSDLCVTDPYMSDIDISLAFATTAFGFSVDSYTSGGGAGASTFEVTLLLAGTAVDSFIFVAPAAGCTFVGFAASTPFDRLAIVESAGGVSYDVGVVDREHFGRFFVGLPAPQPGRISVNITTPRPGAVFEDTAGPITVRAYVYPDESVVKVEFFANAAKIGEDDDGADGWLINSNNLTPKTYYLTAKATDNEGGTTTSPPVRVAVYDNPPPPTFFATESELAAATAATGPIDPPFSAKTKGPIVAGDLSFTPGPNAYNIAVSNVPYNLLDSDLQVDNPSMSDINIDIAHPIIAFGFTLDSYTKTGGAGDSAFELLLLLDTDPVQSFTLVAPANDYIFVGFEAAAPFNRIEMVESAGGIAYDYSTGAHDREYFGRFFVGPRASRIYCVDDDAPADPGPGNPLQSDPLEDGTQAHPFDAIQEAIEAAYDGDTVTVLSGTYIGFGNRDVDFLGKAITVRSEDGPENCVIDCQGSEEEPHRGFYFHSNEDTDSVVDGLTISNGYADKAGGIYCDGSSPAITNCTIADNFAQHYGGGMYNWHSSPTLTYCRFVGNSANNGGGISSYPAGPALSNCEFISNSAGNCGGGMHNHRSCPTLTDCTFTGNSAWRGGGIACWYCYGGPTLVGCRFEGNSARENGGGMANEEGTKPVLVNCTFSGNYAGESGGGIYSLYDGRPTLHNCVFAGNLAVASGGAICNYGGIDPTLTNCTLVGNSAANGSAVACDSEQQRDPSSLQVVSCICWDGGDEIWNNDNSVVTITDTDVQGGWPGECNIDADPCFLDPGYWDPNGTPDDTRDDFWVAGDYHLKSDSPCIDAGDPSYVPEPNETDLDGKPRIIGGRIDMGAYEFNHIPVADAGPDETVCLWMSEMADVSLDGSGSYDDDNQPLMYRWTWTVDSEAYEASGMGPTIELPLGEHVIELVVNDGMDDSEPDEVIITVVGPMESEVSIFPRAINRDSRQRHMLAWVRLGEGVTRDQIDIDQPLLLYPGGIEATRQHVFEYGQPGSRQSSIFAFFDKAEVMDAVVDNGRVELQVVGRLKTGQCFHGADTVRIIGSHWRPWPRRR